MGRFNSRIYAGLIIFFMCFSSCILLGDSASQLQDAELKTFMTPKYNPETKKLEYILTGKNAETVGTLIRIEDARLEIIGPDGNSITTVITTPEAYYDRVADYVKGYKPVHYRSLQMDGDGIGFRLSNIDKKLTIDKDVKLFIYQNNTVKVEKKSDVKNKNESTTTAPEAISNDSVHMGNKVGLEKNIKKDN
jgi:hypothetical protein